MTVDALPDVELKARHRAMWGWGDYPAVAREVIADLGPRLVDAAKVGPTDRVLDVAAGSGNATFPAAATGASVVAVDLSPDLLAAGRAAGDGLDQLIWQEADAEHLPFAEAAFDVVVSCVGVMFAPHHQEAADELVRVLRPGGRLALLSWTPAGFIGRMFATMKPYAPPPPVGSSPPPLWGDPDHVAALLGDRVTDLTAEREALPVNRFGSGAEFRDFFKACYGPTIGVYRGLDQDRAAELDAALAALGDNALHDGVMDWEYLLVTATRA